MISRSDNRLPEERKSPYKELTEMLRHAYSKPVQVSPERQAQALARARARLGFTDSEIQQVSSDRPSMNGTMPVNPESTETMFSSVSQQHGFSRLVSLIAAMLVVGVLIVSSLLIFRVRHPMTVASTPVTTTPTTVTSSEIRTHDLDAVLQVSPGPYFLGEMVEVHLTLTNYSSTSDWNMKSGYDAKNCAPDLANNLAVVMTGNRTLADTTLQHSLAGFDCSDVAQEYGTLDPPPPGVLHGFTLPVYTTTVLTYSGLVTLATPLRFIDMYTQKYDQPLGGRTPSIQIYVQARMPAGRLITGEQHGTQVTINAPPSARNQLLYTYKTTCPGNPSWQWAVMQQPPLTLQKPKCINNPSGKVTEWAYVVGAPGYAVFTGSVNY